MDAEEIPPNFIPNSLRVRDEEDDVNPSSAALLDSSAALLDSSASLLDDKDSNAAAMKPGNFPDNDGGKLEIL